ncbi:hypothetical protein TGAM01_v204228 [Trichoderma gamsii]|uniref:Uncharacterized protein n=1 Tax=Trichoderma gamsii TaxID=398673 RepID=A0A2P4ZR00_9HYPO|nr:hypothetical protein TGAM01_v204228 [Trichoderma gamsii]PON26727.1 hypothetical protein TGAM01_v204228 [Trichoderma gamsii]
MNLVLPNHHHPLGNKLFGHHPCCRHHQTSNPATAAGSSGLEHSGAAALRRCITDNQAVLYEYRAILACDVSEARPFGRQADEEPDGDSQRVNGAAGPRPFPDEAGDAARCCHVDALSLACPGNVQISAVATAWRAMASPGLMVSDFATANLSRGGRTRHANFSPPVTRVEWNARAPGRGPGPATLPSGSGSFVPTWLGASCRSARHGTPPAFFAASSSSPVQSAVVVSTDLSGPLHLRSPLHPIQVATPSIVKPAVGKRKPWDD